MRTTTAEKIASLLDNNGGEIVADSDPGNANPEKPYSISANLEGANLENANLDLTGFRQARPRRLHKNEKLNNGRKNRISIRPQRGGNSGWRRPW